MRAKTKTVMVGLLAVVLCAGTAWAGGERSRVAAPDIQMGDLPGGGGGEGGSRDAPDIYVDGSAVGCVSSPQGDPYLAGLVYCSIQDAITDAAPGDVIHVAPGTYSENVIINKKITLDGAGSGSNPSTNTVIDGGGGHVIKITAGGSSASERLIIKDLYLDNGNHGIHIDVTVAYITLENVTSANSGYGLEVHNSGDVTDLVISNCTFTGNSASGMRIRNKVDGLTVTGTHFDNNQQGLNVYGTADNVIFSNCTFNNNDSTTPGDPWTGGFGMYLGYWSPRVPPETLSNWTIENCEFDDNNGNTGGAGAAFNHGIAFQAEGTEISNIAICNCRFTNNDSVGVDIYADGDTITDVSLQGNDFSGSDIGVWIDEATASLVSGVSVNYSSIVGNVVGVQNDAASEVDAENSWWGHASGPAPGGSGNSATGIVDTDPFLTTDQIHLLSGGNRLVDMQQDDGGWDWPLYDGDPTDASPLNTVGPIAMGLAKAYRATGDATMLAALQDAGGLLLSKTNNFSPSDGYLAAELDAILGGTTYVEHVTDNFYGPLAAGTYNYKGLGPLYDTAGYVMKIRTDRASQGIANLAAWDLGMGLVGAASAGASTSEWVAGVKAEIDELDGSEYYDVIGLAGAVYGLAFVGEDYIPTAGEHYPGATTWSDLVDILASYQITESGGFAWNKDYVIAYDFNETIQETAYAVMALREIGGYDAEVASAIAYMKSVQLCTGGWENYIGSSSGENNEVTGEAMWAIAMPVQNLDTGKTFPSIQDAIDDADTVNGHTLEIQTSVHTEGQIVVSKNLTIQGGSVDTIKMTEDTGSSGDTRGWFLVNPDVTLVVSDLIFDGNGYLVHQGFRHKGNGSFTNCTFRDIKYNESGPTYAGLAIVAFGGAGNPVNVTDCVFEDIGRVGVLYFGTGVNGSVFSGSRYTGKSSGNWLDYALDISAGAVVTVQNSTFTECRGVADSDGSTSAGVMVTTYYDPGTSATITGCTIAYNTTGIAVGYDASDASTVVATGNFIYGNGLYTGIDTLSSVMVDATGNWWGDATGPDDDNNDAGETHDIGGDPGDCGTPASDYNTGTGDAVGDTSTEVVDYCPWVETYQRLALEADDCQDDMDGMDGHQIAVELWMRDVTTPVTGYTAFMQFDDSKLTFVSGTYEAQPFPQHVPGTIGLVSGETNLLEAGGYMQTGDAEWPGATGDWKLATLVFTVEIECEMTALTLQSFGPFDSELSYQGAPVPTALVNTPVISLDDTDPTATAPTTVDLECSTALPGAATTIAQFLALAGADASDNCTAQANLTVSSVDGGLVGDECNGTITRTYTITDECGNSTDVDHVFTVTDDTDPTATAPTTVDLECSTALPGAATTIAQFLALAGADASDNCTAQANLTVSSVDGGLVGDECNGTITRTYTITDECGNSTDVDHVFTVTDDTDPWFQGGTFPANVSQNADAGVCTAVIVPAIVPPTGVDNCDASPLVEYKRSDRVNWNEGLTDAYDAGVTTITWRVTDSCSEFYTQDQTVTVNAVNDVDVVVELVGVSGSVTRCIHFVLDDCQFVDVDLDFTGSPASATATIEVPCDAWTMLCAKDEQHTLYDDTTLTDEGTYYSTGAVLVLEPGDTDNDSDVDINDITWLMYQWGGGGSAADGGCPWDTTRDADFDNGGFVDGTDYLLLSNNWHEWTTCACAKLGAGYNVDLAALESAVLTSELPANVADAIDLNRDGVVDYLDVEEFEAINGLPNTLSSQMKPTLTPAKPMNMRLGR